MSLSTIITVAIGVAICIVIVMMALGALGITNPIARYAGFFAACAAGIILGQMIHRKYIGK